jgi:N-methylhydantoinase A/oxoprolinase/acetone carboxylase beta subunit
MAREPRVLAIDAGGTMTDTFVVDHAGAFVVGARAARGRARR